MRLIAALSVFVTLLGAQTERRLESVTAVRHWAVGGVTRIAIEVTGDFHFRTDRLHNPERVYFDILDARPRIQSRRIFTEELQDALLKRIRVAETLPGVTRVVLEVADDAEATPSQLTNPDRLIVELRNMQVTGIPRSTAPAFAAPAVVAAPSVVAVPVKLPPEPPFVQAPLPATPPLLAMAPPRPVPYVAPKPVRPVFRPEPLPAAPAKSAVLRMDPPPPIGAPATEPAAKLPGTAIPEVGKAARHNSSGDTSLVRALGLKITRVVIDPGHGGHDQGTSGPRGLLEKDLVLDVSKRVGRLVAERLGAEVIYTRSDDTFIPLEGRTALANERHADLFLSIHANSSPSPRITGVETYYLNFTDSKDALDVAARENASSQKSVFELRELTQRIALHEKLGESKEFAARIQTSLSAFSARSMPGSRNRGVKKAPFVVLIGAQMPSVLAEIGFLSNPREEALLKRPDYREKLADAIFRGVSRYVESLSHFQVASAKD